MQPDFDFDLAEVLDSARIEAKNLDGSKNLKTWIEWFCSLAVHEFVLQVPEEFLNDKMNLISLSNP